MERVILRVNSWYLPKREMCLKGGVAWSACNCWFVLTSCPLPGAIGDLNFLREGESIRSICSSVVSYRIHLIGLFHSLYFYPWVFVQSLKACISWAGSKDLGRCNHLDLLQISPNAAHRSVFPFKHKWTTWGVQMALFPITGLGGFQSYCKNAVALT